MTRLRTDLLTDDLYRRLSGSEIASRANQAIVLCTVDSDGWPYNAKLNLHIAQVVFDEPPPDLEPGICVTGGITYSPRTAGALARAHAVLAELLET